MKIYQKIDRISESLPSPVLFWAKAARSCFSKWSSCSWQHGIAIQLANSWWSLNIIDTYRYYRYYIYIWYMWYHKYSWTMRILLVYAYIYIYIYIDIMQIWWVLKQLQLAKPARLKHIETSWYLSAVLGGPGWRSHQSSCRCWHPATTPPPTAKPEQLGAVLETTQGMAFVRHGRISSF